MTEPTLIREMMEGDWKAVSVIYAQGIAGGNATFEQNVPTWQQFDSNHLQQCRLVAVEDGLVVGWAALSPVSRRAVYSGVAEISVYVADTAKRKGIGSLLLDATIQRSEACGIWTLQGSIFPENAASMRLVESRDFRRVGFRERIGKMSGTWRDTVLVERRSKVAGN